jgi:hypothetical protein
MSALADNAEQTQMVNFATNIVQKNTKQIIKKSQQI